MSELTAERLRELLHYDPETGVFTWRVSTSRRVRAGDVAGYRDAKYTRVRVSGYPYAAQRLAWLYVHGVWPVDQLDHRDGDKHHNAISNLRECSNAENQQNREAQRNSASGLMGAHRVKNSTRWSTSITVNETRHYLGLFPTPEAAHAAYLAAKQQLHTFQPTPRKITTKAQNDSRTATPRSARRR